MAAMPGSLSRLLRIVFVTVVGYDDAGGAKRYGCLNTWDGAVHWFDFVQMAAGRPWGIYGAVTFAPSCPPPAIEEVHMQARGLTVAFSATVSTAPVSYTWDFGDGATSTMEAPTHTYPVSDVYWLTLTVENRCGSDTEQRPLILTALPFQAYLPLAPRGGWNR